MSIRSFLKDRIIPIACGTAIIVFTAVFLSVFSIPRDAIVFLALLLALAGIVLLSVEYLRKRGYYVRLQKTLDGLDKKHLISELMEDCAFLEGEILNGVVAAAAKSMNDEISVYKRLSSDYREYIETWVHEIKTPIASALLTAQNNPSPAAKSIEGDLKRIESLVMNVLYYARSTNVERDYIIKEMPLKSIVNAAVRANSRSLIEAGVRVNVDIGDEIVFTDDKWLVFILGQLIANSISYRQASGAAISFFAHGDDTGVELAIKDNGVGVPPGDIARVFEKGFTGENGRRHSASTGMGLYLCQKLCKKLGLGISARSGNGFEVTISFPQTNMYTAVTKNYAAPV